LITHLVPPRYSVILVNDRPLPYIRAVVSIEHE
jgi:hypothetical protein